jgi:hypothetical protein
MDMKKILRIAISVALFACAASAGTSVSDSTPLGALDALRSRQILKVFQLPVPAGDYGDFEAYFQNGRAIPKQYLWSMERGPEPFCFLKGKVRYSDRYVSYEAYEQDIENLKNGSYRVNDSTELHPFSVGISAKNGKITHIVELLAYGEIGKVTCVSYSEAPPTVGDLKRAFGQFVEVTYKERAVYPGLLKQSE